MSITPPHHHLSPGSPRLFSKARVLLKREWEHADTIPTKTLLLLVAASAALALLCPLLPPAAYGLQLWASLSPTWRDRWASLRAGARYAGWYVAFLLIYTALDGTHFWGIPTLTHLFQLFWQEHLPGTLSLSPLDLKSIVARSLLLLPLAPAISLFYERMDPHVSTHLNRVLTPADLVESKAPPAVQTNPVSKKRKKPQGNLSKTTQKTRSSPSSQQSLEDLTIPVQKSPEVAPAHPQQPTPAPSSTTINWDEVVE